MSTSTAIGSFATAILLSFAGCVATAAEAAPPPSIRGLSDSLEQLSVRVSPAVVHIEARGAALTPGSRTARALGSGFVVDPDGWILTAAHVVQGAERIDVTVVQPGPQGRPGRSQQLPARLVGLDEDSDVAVLKVAAKELPALTLGDSNAVRKGQMVLAFGSPMGLDGTVSMGVIGAVDRQPDPDNPVVYLQSDAAINPGNSGGPLVDANGSVVGINTFIVSTTGGNQGLGFAVTSDIVRDVYEQIRKEGSVWHGTIGAQLQNVTPVLQDELGLARSWGALVVDVFPEGPADSGNLELHDIVVAIDGDAVETARELNARVHATRPGTIVTLDVLRGGGEVEALVRIAGRPGDTSGTLASLDPRKNGVPALHALCVTLDDTIRPILPGLRSEDGVLVVAVDGGADPAQSLQPGDVIVQVGKQPTPDLGVLRRTLGSYAPDANALVRVERAGAFRYLQLEVER